MSRRLVRVRMLDSESARLVDDGPQVHLRAGQEYDVPEWLVQAWEDRAPPLCERVRAAKKTTRTTDGG